MSDLISQHSHEKFVWSLLFISAILIDSPMANNAEYLFMYLFAICISSLMKCLFMSFAHILIELLVLFSLLSFLCSLYILDTSPLPDMWFTNIFFHFLGYLLIFLRGFFTEHTFFNFDEAQLTNFPLMDYAFGVKSKNSFYIALDPEEFLFCYFLKVL